MALPTIHWLGAGLSTAPGILRLASGNSPLVVWNRTISKAQQIVDQSPNPVDVRVFDLQQLGEAVQPGDVLVSMLPGDWHVPVAQLALTSGAHFVSSSYISDAMRELDSEAKQRGLCLVNEVGLDPGIDHLMAHALVKRYRESEHYKADNHLYFRSYCGGFPSIPNDFRYKFSWSPLGVLRALKSPSRSLRDGQVYDVQRPWHAITPYLAHLPGGRTEVFEAYPNRDALPFMDDYQFDPDWNVQEFVRGTLRLDGWAQAWQTIFEEIECLEGEEGDRRLQAMSDELWQTQSYDEGEPDRVVLCVELEARGQQHGADQTPVWHQSYAIDALGNEQGNAMARLVSITVSLAVEAVLQNRIEAGVSAAPEDPVLIEDWFSVYETQGDKVALIDHLLA